MVALCNDEKLTGSRTLLKSPMDQTGMTKLKTAQSLFMNEIIMFGNI